MTNSKLNNQTIKIVHLYANELNVYGDDGNVLIIKKRMAWQGFNPQIIKVGVGEDIPADTNLIVAGGGQDSSQDKVQQDLKKKRESILKLAKSDVPMLLVCGSYQLFGDYFLTADGVKVDGVGILDIHTEAGANRLIGNITANSSEFGQLHGFENHSGKTYISDSTTEPLAEVVKGHGNNDEDEFEGARKYNIIGTYLHGSILSRNPRLADWLVLKALLSAGLSEQDIEECKRTHPLPPELNQIIQAARAKDSNE